MTLPYYRNPARTAKVIVDRIEAGLITTPGQWKSTVETLAWLPPRTREWCLYRIEARIGASAISYIRAQLPGDVPA